MGWWPDWFPGRSGITAPGAGLSLEAREKLCKSLRVDSIASVQDVLNSLLLSECVYKVHDLGPQEAVKHLRATQSTFPAGLTSIQAVQCSKAHVQHRYLVASSPQTIFVSFIGTKLAKDLLVDANLLHKPLWQAPDPGSELPAAHRGFLARSKRIPVELLLSEAQKSNRKLLFCGHSLGGAVAILCTLRVLQQASAARQAPPRVQCITFGTPAIGNSALATRVRQQGWQGCFQNIILPEDMVPRLLALNPEASSPEVSILTPAVAAAPTETDGGGRPFWRQNGGFASRLTTFRRPPGLDRTASALVGAAAGAATLLRPVVNSSSDEIEAQQGNDVLEGRQVPMTQSEPRRWTLPKRLWHQSNGPGPIQDTQVLPRRAESPNELSTIAEAQHSAEEMHAPDANGRGGVLQSIGRRLPRQGWWSRSPPSDAAKSAANGQDSVEEDGAVDILVSGPSSDASGGSIAPEKAVEARKSWLERLSQLQNLAVSAAASVGNPGQLLPTYVHFGKTVIWLAPPEASEVPAAFPGNDLRSRILANHRLPAYRVRAWAHCQGAGGELGHRQEDSTTCLTEELLPRIDVRAATADFPPIPPIKGNGASTNRWSWIPYLGSDDSLQSQSTWVRLRVDGRALEWLQQGRLLAYGSTWCPVRILRADKSQPRAATLRPEQSRSEAPAARQRRPAAEAREGDALVVEACLPNAVTSQIFHGLMGGHSPALELHLRSDFAELRVPSGIRLPTVWLLGSSATAARRLMTDLSANFSLAKTNALQPAELVLDGAKWCNLLAAPVTTPAMAMSALNMALAPSCVEDAAQIGPMRFAVSMLLVRMLLPRTMQPLHGCPGIRLLHGKIEEASLASGVCCEGRMPLQGLRAWVLGPQSNLREGSSCSVIVYAMDGNAAIPQRQLAQLVAKAEKAGVKCVLTSPEEAIPANGEQTRALPARLVKLGPGSPDAAALMSLRRVTFQALSECSEVRQPLSKL